MNVQDTYACSVCLILKHVYNNRGFVYIILPQMVLIMAYKCLTQQERCGDYV